MYKINAKCVYNNKFSRFEFFVTATDKETEKVKTSAAYLPLDKLEDSFYLMEFITQFFEKNLNLLVREGIIEIK